MMVRTMVEKVRGRIRIIVKDFGHFDVLWSVKVQTVQVLRLTAYLKAVVALVTRTWGLKAILLEDGGDEGAGVCNEEE